MPLDAEAMAAFMVPPHCSTEVDGSNGTAQGQQSRIKITAFTVSAIQDNVLSGTQIPDSGCWVTWIADSDCYVHFFNFAQTGFTATASNSLYLPAGVAMNLFHRKGIDDGVAVIRKTADGSLYRWRSSP